MKTCLRGFLRYIKKIWIKLKRVEKASTKTSMHWRQNALGWQKYSKPRAWGAPNIIVTFWVPDLLRGAQVLLLARQSLKCLVLWNRETCYRPRWKSLIESKESSWGLRCFQTDLTSKPLCHSDFSQDLHCPVFILAYSWVLLNDIWAESATLEIRDSQELTHCLPVAGGQRFHHSVQQTSQPHSVVSQSERGLLRACFVAFLSLYLVWWPWVGSEHWETQTCSVPPTTSTQNWVYTTWTSDSHVTGIWHTMVKSFFPPHKDHQAT